MFSKESCGKKEKSRRRGTTSSPYFGEKDKKEKKTSATSASSALRPVPSEKRKLKSDHTDILYYQTNGRQELKRLNVEIDVLKKRPKISSSSQGSIKFQETSYSNDNQIISQSPSSNGNKKDTSRCIDFKLKDIKFTNVRSKFDHGIKNLSSPTIANDVKPKAEGQADEKKWTHLRAQREKMKELKKERNHKFRDSSEKYVLEKCKKNQVSQDYNSNKIAKEHLESKRKVSAKIPVNSCDSLQKPAEENVFNLDFNKLETNQEKKECLESSEVSLNLSRHKMEHFFSDSTCKWTHMWKGKYHERQGSNDSNSRENLTQSFEAPCSSGSSENIQDTDQEMQIVEELHAARVGKSLDLPLVPPSGELMSMEIDLVEDDVHSSAGNTPLDKKLLIVIDTNILMNHLKFVRVLKTTEIPDGLSDENNDDRVLKCCLQHQELFPCSLVILCTDDRNLRNKGLISGVKSLSKEELSAELLNLSLNTDACHQLCISKEQLKAEAALLEESYEKESTGSGLSILLESIVSDLEKSLGTALSSILETEMKMAFGNLWMEMLYLKPPWTLIHLLQCFKKHWLAVFGLIMEKNLLLTVESLYENLHRANNTVDFTTVKFLLQDSKSLLHAFSTRSNYDGILPQAFAQVNKLLQAFAEVKTKLKANSSENTVSKNQETTSSVKSHNQEMAVFSESHLPQPNRHQEIWSILENVWITIYQNSMDVFERLGSNSALTTSKIASFEEAFIYLQKLMAAVKDILEGIQRILAPNSNFQDVETLYNFLIKNEVNKNVTFTAQELYDCVSQIEYREKLTIGCCQLVEMDYTMQQCNASVYMEAKKRGWCEDTLNYRT
ncbi:transcriptional protein SWT1 isoform X4 [Otolemur garnettii]|uniref:transcriptional protein SWT1 isoform X4 n=1 Tax=Otolemur garnettii TaxID=30611 RepID=UPI000C7F65FA|nr:transcriptional protein SWT1 isoform X4 [Otolemur garnettii]